jgi:hypothetical protein
VERAVNVERRKPDKADKDDQWNADEDEPRGDGMPVVVIPADRHKPVM